MDPRVFQIQGAIRSRSKWAASKQANMHKERVQQQHLRPIMHNSAPWMFRNDSWIDCTARNPAAVAPPASLTLS